MEQKKKYVIDGKEFDSYEEAMEYECIQRILRNGNDVDTCRYCGKPNPLGFWKCEWCGQ